MVVARRPLKKYELECAVMLEENTDDSTRQARGSILAICNPLLDVDDEPTGMVKFCHFTALEYAFNAILVFVAERCGRYIKSSGFDHLQGPLAELIAVSSCLSALDLYLVLAKPSNVPKEILERIVLPSYDFSLYAIDFWIDHLQNLSKTDTLSNNEGRQLRERISQKLGSIARACEEYHNDKVECSSESHFGSTQLEAAWRSLELERSTRIIINKYLASGEDTCFLRTPTKDSKYFRVDLIEGQQAEHRMVDGAGAISGPLLPKLRSHYQEMVETALSLEELANERLSSFKARRGLGAYLCRHQGCRRAADGFDSVDLRQQHEDSHGPRFQCCEASCGFFGWTFKTRNAMKRHEAKYHTELRPPDVPYQLSEDYPADVLENYDSNTIARLRTPDFGIIRTR